MSTSSKNCEDANKVVVVNSNEFYALKKIKHQKKGSAKGNQAVSNASSISNVCSQSIAGTSSSSNPQASTSSKSIHENITSTTSKSCICKLVSKKHVATGTQSHKSAQKKKSKRNIPIIEKDVAEIIFPNLSKATEDETISVEEISRNQSIFIDETMSQEKVIELISKRYGKTLEAQISLLQENTVTESLTKPLYVDTTLSPSQETRATVSTSNEEIENAKRHLETIVIPDSPREHYQILSSKELKILPDKIFASPPKPTIKQEMQSAKEEGITKGSIKAVLQLQNLDMKSKDDFRSKKSLLMIAPHSINFLEKKDVNNIQMEAVGRRNFWEMEQKDLNFGVLVDEEKPSGESDEKTKKIAISDVDAVIFKEMDLFIEDIELKNTSSKIIVHGPTEENSIPKYTVEGNKENLDPKYENGGLSPTKRLKDFDDIVKQRMTHDHIQTTMNLGETEDQLKFEIVKKFDKGDQNGPGKLPDTTFKVPEEERGKEEVESSKKIDILEKLVSETGIGKYGEQPTEECKDTMEIEQPKLMKDEVLEEGINECGDKTTEETENTTETKPPKPKEDGVSEESEDPNPVEACKENEANHHKPPEGSTDICRSSTCERTDSSEYQILIIKEDGFLEPLNATPVADLKSSNGNEESSPDQSGLNEEKGIRNDGISKEEILALLEKAKSIKFEDAMEGSAREKLKSLSRTLRDQIRVLKQLYGKLEIFVDSRRGEPKDEDMCALQDDLNFVKSVIERTFIKEEKKLKFKVISVNKKAKPVTKKVYDRTAPRTARNKLLRRTLFQINRLMVALQMNRALLLSDRRRAFVSKLRQMAKKKEEEKSDGAESDSSKTNEAADEDLVIENGENSKTSSEGQDRLLTVVLERTDGAISSEKEKSVDVQSPVKIDTPCDAAIPKVEKKKRGSKPSTFCTKTDKKLRRASERLKKDFKAKRHHSGRYFLRSRTENSIVMDLDKSKESCEGELSCQTDFDSDLEKSKRPSTALRPKAINPKPILEETFDDFHNRNIGYLLKDGTVRRRPGTNRYEMRSRSQEQMVLRSRRT